MVYTIGAKRVGLKCILAEDENGRLVLTAITAVLIEEIFDWGWFSVDKKVCGYIVHVSCSEDVH